MVIRAFHYRGVSMSVPEEGASTTAGVSERQHHNRVAQRQRLRSLTALRWRPPLHYFHLPLFNPARVRESMGFLRPRRR